jgi:hypothetical protein
MGRAAQTMPIADEVPAMMRIFLITLLKSLLAMLLLTAIFAAWRAAEFGLSSLQDADFTRNILISWIILGPGCVLVALIQVSEKWIQHRLSQ